MKVEIIRGSRKQEGGNKKTITIFLMSFVYPATTGYLRRMELLINWANLRFKNINLIIPVGSNKMDYSQIINLHLIKCNQLFLIKYDSDNSKILSIKKLAYKLFTGKYPRMNSSLLLDSSLIKGFKEIMNNHQIDYFLNTRNNYAGLVSFIPDGVISLFDTQDVYSDMYRSFSLLNVNKFIKPLLIGYREKSELFQSEVLSLEKYNSIIAISQSDLEKYKRIDSLGSKTTKIGSIGFEPAINSVAKYTDKKYDLLLIASAFIATERGVDWLLNEVAPKLTIPVTLCVIGSIGKYIENNEYKKSNLKIIIKGVVKDLNPYYHKSKLVVLSMLEGTGTSVKGLEALAFGAAIITTQYGVRSLGLTNGEQVVIEDDSSRFAEKIEYLMENKVKRESLGLKALQFYKDHYSLKATYELLDQLILDNT
ncbi:glycosyltransferase family 4 protein [Polaribacter sp. Z014]|uniref:glycosyltransferase family 4 protein n=1 Tax=Polaribacter sp. Z014 TaxID=2927126 RepID=UPI00201FCDC2|nr:glycosyltransferase family 4 protein [Polaribacter sp. Z014]MCL7765491.1 glycosyltransferase family 4 protein [Polaribacter sp. Z014]